MEIKTYILELLFGELCKEVELLGEPGTVVRIGTTKNCIIRLSREQFLADFELSAVCKEDGTWFVECGEGIYLEQTQLLKLHRLDLHHGDTFTVRYQNSRAALCRGEYYRSFSSEQNDFRRSIELEHLDVVRIGGADDCHVRISDRTLGSDSVTLRRYGGGWELSESGTRYGFEVNDAHCVGSAILRDYDFFSVTGHAFFLRGSRLYFCVDNEIRVAGVPVLEHQDSRSAMTYPHLNRSTRVYYELPEEQIQLQKPPAKPIPPDQNLLMTILPLVIMLGVMVLLRTAIGGNGIFIIFSVCSMGVGVITSLYNHYHHKKKTAQDEERRVQVYTEYIHKKEQSIQAIRDKERHLSEYNTPSIEQTMATVRDFDSRLYERMPEHADYAAVRLGTGEKDSAYPVEYTPDEYRIADDPLADWPEYMQEKYAHITDMPILLELRNTGTVGIVGDTSQIYETVKLMTIDLAVHHSHQDLQIGYLFSEECASQWSWVRWLRHVNNDLSGVRNIACDIDSYKSFMDFLYKVLSERAAAGDAKGRNFGPHYVIFVMEYFDILNHPISKFFTAENNYGFTFLFCSQAAELLPQCKKLVRFDTGTPVIISAKDGNQTQTFAPAYVDDAQAEWAARKLACVTVDEVSLDNQLVKNITLYELLHIFNADDMDYGLLWRTSRIDQTMAAPIGLGSGGELVALDLYEKAHGPHGLVAGTTGSGKSELLQTYILSMAMHYHPYEVGFVIIDFKGGGMANQFQNLPHLIGTITNIDGKTIDRSLKSIRAELHKRERLFAETGVNNIDNYIRKFKAGEATTPLPHLILIVDEFAELKSSQPEFMKALISTSRIGRSLGVHLILATQKPSGVVDEQIWSNSHFRLCLKVQSSGDSNEMLKTPLAAEIKEPGRAYFQVGNNEIFCLFQSAYSGAPADSAITAGQHSYQIDSVSLSGVRRPIFKQQLTKQYEETVTELQAIVESLRKYCDSHDIPKLQGICLPPLAELIPFPAAEPFPEKDPKISVEIGVYDDPENQRQSVYSIPLGRQNVMIIGSSQSGKTNLLQVMIRSLASKYTPSEVQIYIIDFASMALKKFESLAHVGGVVTVAEDEKLKNLFKLLYAGIGSRKEKLNKLGVSSFAAYQEAGETNLPQIVLMIDNLTALKELNFRDDDQLITLCREGQSVGISIVIANAQTSGIGYRYLSNFSCRVALFCNDSSEYISFFDHCRTRIGDIRGRCIVEMEKAHFECQSYLAFSGEREIERVQEIRSFIARTCARYPSLYARRIPMIPTVLTDLSVQSDYTVPQHAPFNVVAGLDYANVEPVLLPFDQLGALTIAGRGRSGKHNWVRYAIHALTQRAPERLEVYLVDGVGKKYAPLKDLPSVKHYSILPEDAKAFIVEIEQRLKRRYEAILQETNTEDDALLVLILDNYDAVESICSDSAALASYKNIVSRYKQLNVCMLISCIPNENIPYSASEIMKSIRDNHNVLYFGDLSELKLFDVPLVISKQFKKRIELGDCYYLRGNSCIKLKTPLSTK